MSSQAFLHVLFDLGVLIAFLVPVIMIGWHLSDREFTTRDWAYLTGLLLIAGLFTRIEVVSLVAGLVLVAMGIAWVWHTVILLDLRYERTFSRTHLFPDEEAEITWSIENDKPLPISWLRWQEPIPLRPFEAISEDGIAVDGLTIRPLVYRQQGIDELTSVGGFETLIRSAPVRALRRGYYRFGPVTWQASDVLGLFTAHGTTNDESSLTVYPRVFSLEHLNIPFNALMGDVRRRHALLQDPTWYRGAREYHAGDPMKTIDWKATARRDQLHVRLFEPTVHPKFMIVANLHAFERIWEGVLTEYMEDVISTAASVAMWALESGYEVGINSNGVVAGQNRSLRIMPSAVEDQKFLILEYLAKIMLIADRPVEDILRADLDDLPHGTTAVICSNVVTQGMISGLAETGRRRQTVLLLVDNESTFTIPNVAIVHVAAGERAA